MNTTSKSFSTTLQEDVALNYWLDLPDQYTVHEQYPLILFLHGRGQRGHDLNQVRTHGLPKAIDEGLRIPFIVAAPQCPANTHWSEQVIALKALTEHLIQSYPIDPQRVYLTGLSMGGTGTWLLATYAPHLFAAIAPLCGVALRWAADERLHKMPIWVFHNQHDPVVPLYESENMVKALLKAGNPVKFTIYPRNDHDAWTETYQNPALFTWLLSNRLNAEL